MWNLDDSTKYAKVLDLSFDWATTWADTRAGRTDKDKRERIRRAAEPVLASRPTGVKKWAFRITVNKTGRRPFDIENVAKPIIDAFCERQIERDESLHLGVGLFPDDSLDYVIMLQVAGNRIVGVENTRVEIFAVKEVNAARAASAT